MTRILLAAPVRNRGWILPAYLECLSEMRIPEGVRLELFFLVNGEASEGDRAVLERFAAAVQPRLAVEVVQCDTPPPAPPTRETDNRLRLFSYLAELRNATIERALAGGYDYLFSVDSDILVPPHTLESLLGACRDIVSAVLINDEFWALPAERRNPNLLRLAPYPGRGGAEAYEHVRDLPPGGLVEVDVTGACFLIARRVLEAGVRFADHYLGEDVPFCQAARERGFHLYGHCGVRAEHKMAQHTWIDHAVLRARAGNDRYLIELQSGDRRRLQYILGPQATEEALTAIYAKLFADCILGAPDCALPPNSRVEKFYWDKRTNVMEIRLAEPGSEALPSAPPRTKPRRPAAREVVGTRNSGR